MLRRDFLSRLARTAAGLLVAEDAAELLLEPSRKLWPGHSFDDGLWQTGHRVGKSSCSLAELDAILKEVMVPLIQQELRSSSYLLSRFKPYDGPGRRLEFSVLPVSVFHKEWPA
jgi:hypothetical protein